MAEADKHEQRYAEWAPAPILVDHLSKEPPNQLYHYTSQAGFLGILRSHELWTSNIHYLNDHREFTFGVDLFYDYLRREHDKATNDKRRHVVTMIDRLNRQLHPQTPFYVASWSAEDDDLAQWRAYSGSGTGYAIGMGGATIARLAKKQKFTFAGCVYTPDEHEEWIKQIVATSLQEMIDDERKGIQYHRAEPGDNFLVRLLRFSPLIKHPKFSGEKEWRLIADFPLADMHEDFALREGRSTLIPHFRFKLEFPGEIPVAFSDIVVGPCAEPELAQAAAMSALFRYAKGNNGGRYTVRQSQVPYRNW